MRYLVQDPLVAVRVAVGPWLAFSKQWRDSQGLTIDEARTHSAKPTTWTINTFLPGHGKWGEELSQSHTPAPTFGVREWEAACRRNPAPFLPSPPIQQNLAGLGPAAQSRLPWLTQKL